jgi:murein DD-endopeptidase MepM/ murein hydrolase activator NlpD
MKLFVYLKVMMHPLNLVWKLFLAAAGAIALAAPTQAIEVTVQPTTVRLGDTISVVVTPNPGERLSKAPTVKVEDKTFPVFQLSPNRWRALVPTTPLERHGRRRLTVTGNQQTRNLLVWVGDRTFPTQSIWLPPGKDDEGSDYEFDQADAFKALVTPQKFWNGRLLRPNNGPLSTGYGVRRYYNGVFANDYYHRGLDYASGTGSPVMAMAAGRVALLGLESQGFKIHGNVVGVDHGQGVASIYLHLSRIDVKKGQMVRAGQVIGAVGSTGATTGPHLHMGLYVNGQAVDPAPWFNRTFE